MNQLPNEIHRHQIKALWSKYLLLPQWHKKPLLIHGDLLPSNILIKNNHLSAVIDFSDVGMGDPTCDLVIAWSLFNSNSRNVFRNNLKNINDETWEKGKAWALAKAMIMLAYYQNKSLKLSLLARRIRDNILKEEL